MVNVGLLELLVFSVFDLRENQYTSATFLKISLHLYNAVVYDHASCYSTVTM